MTTWQEALTEVVDRLFPRMVALRRHLHVHPELSGAEYATTSYLREQLASAGFAVTLGPDQRGLWVDFPSGSAGAGDVSRPARRLGLRADIDGLPIQDEKSVPYCSHNKGVMHACGHDAHTAVVFGALLAIRELVAAHGAPSPSLRAIFQPAEETGTGALEMIAAGAIQDVHAILACHVDPTRSVGRIGLRAGAFTASCDDLRIEVQGAGGHAARPHETRDPIAAAAQLIQWLYAQIPRTTDSQEAVVVSIGKIAGGESNNVIPDRVVLLGTVRTLDEAVRQRTCEQIRRLAGAVAAGTGTSITVTFDGGCRAVVNDGALVDRLHESCLSVFGPDAIDRIPRPSMGSEDFASYGEHLPVAMFRLGCRSEQVGGNLLHTPTFDIDEEALRVGARLFAHTVLRWFESSNR